MSENLNGTCAICGEKYHVCSTCKSIKTFMPWRTITDTIDCYKIYMIVSDYDKGRTTKEKAKEELESVTLPKTFQPHIKKVVDEILGVEKSTVKAKKAESTK